MRAQLRSAVRTFREASGEFVDGERQVRWERKRIGSVHGSVGADRGVRLAHRARAFEHCVRQVRVYDLERVRKHELRAALDRRAKKVLVAQAVFETPVLLRLLWGLPAATLSHVLFARFPVDARGPDRWRRARSETGRQVARRVARQRALGYEVDVDVGHGPSRHKVSAADHLVRKKTGSHEDAQAKDMPTHAHRRR